METVLSIQMQTRRFGAASRNTRRGTRRRARGRCQHSAARALFRWRRCLARRSRGDRVARGGRLDDNSRPKVSRPSDGPRRVVQASPGQPRGSLVRPRGPRTRSRPSLLRGVRAFPPRSRPPSGGHPHPRTRPRRNVVTFADRSPREPPPPLAFRSPRAAADRRGARALAARHAGVQTGQPGFWDPSTTARPDFATPWVRAARSPPTRRRSASAAAPAEPARTPDPGLGALNPAFLTPEASAARSPRVGDERTENEKASVRRRQRRRCSSAHGLDRGVFRGCLRRDAPVCSARAR